MLVTVEQPGVGSQIMPGTPVKALGYSDDVSEHAPGVGEHTDLVLRQVLGMTEPEIDALRIAGAL